MYYEHLLPQRVTLGNTALLSGRETGKTTFLKKAAEYCIGRNIRTVVIDSTCDHAEKSLLKYLEPRFSDAVRLDTDIADIDSIAGIIGDPKRLYEAAGIYKTEINGGGLILADVSRFLEESYDYEGAERIRVRNKYKLVSAAVMAGCLECSSPTMILMDEIELIGGTDSLVGMLNERGIFLTDAIHGIGYLGDSTGRFYVTGSDG